MRFLGGGVGHRGVGVSLEMSRTHAGRSKRRRGNQKAAEDTFHDTKGTSDHLDSDEGDITDVDREEDPEDTCSGSSREDDEDEDGDAEDSEAGYADGKHPAEYSDYQSEFSDSEDEDEGVDNDSSPSAEPDDDGLRDTVYANEGFMPL